MASYITQREAGTFSDTIGNMAEVKAQTLLSAASGLVDDWCNRTFTGEELTDQVKCAVAMLAEWLSTANTGGAAGPITSEKVGDYTVNYATTTMNIPLAVQMLLASSRIITVA
jgi:hypothetical protein